MKIGNAHYNCSCVRYVSKVTPDDQETSQPPRLIIVVSVGFGLLAILIIIAIIVATCRRCGKKPNEGIVAYNSNGIATIEATGTHAGRAAPAIAEGRNNAAGYSSFTPYDSVENPDYRATDAYTKL